MTALEKVRRGIIIRYKARLWSLSRLAREAKYDKATVSRILTGTVKNPEWDVVEQLAAALGTSIAELVQVPEKSLVLGEEHDTRRRVKVA